MHAHFHRQQANTEREMGFKGHRHRFRQEVFLSLSLRQVIPEDS